MSSSRCDQPTFIYDLSKYKIILDKLFSPQSLRPPLLKYKNEMALQWNSVDLTTETDNRCARAVGILWSRRRPSERKRNPGLSY